VAGKGVRLTADTENNRWVVEADETVLWEKTSGTSGCNKGGSLTTSEPVTNFERYRIYLLNYERQQQAVIEKFADTTDTGTTNKWVTLECFQSNAATPDSFFTVNCGAGTWDEAYNVFSYNGGYAFYYGSDGGFHKLSATGNTPYIQKIVGVNRIASN
jgi:hypothetical protein